MTVLERQIDAIDTQIDLLRDMVAALKKAVTAPRASAPPLPEACRKEPAETCARQNDDALVSCGGMGGGPQTWMCRGCGEQVTDR